MNINDVHHFVVTRINMGMYASTPKSFLNTLEAKNRYMKARLPVIRKYHITSMKYQTDKNFKVIWIVDDKTPEVFVREIEEMSKEIDATIIFDKWPDGENIVEGNCLAGNWLEKFKPMIKSENVAITRLDSDDAVTNNFISVIKGYFEEPPVCIDFWRRLTIDTRGRLFLLQAIPQNTARCTPTVTCIEKTVDLKTPFLGSHFKLSKIFPVKIYDDLVWCKRENRPPTSRLISHLKESRLEDIKGFEGLGF